MIKELDNYYLSKEGSLRECLLALRSIILAQDDNVAEVLKYGMPCFCYKKKAFCYLWADKKTEEPYILMVEGKLLNHPELEVGDRTRMKIFRVDSNEDLPLAIIEGLINDALDLYRNGIIEIK